MHFLATTSFMVVGRSPKSELIKRQLLPDHTAALERSADRLFSARTISAEEGTKVLYQRLWRLAAIAVPPGPATPTRRVLSRPRRRRSTKALRVALRIVEQRAALVEKMGGRGSA
jgi:hypothetical protein